MYYDKKVDSSVIKESAFYLGNAAVNKSTFNMPEQKPVEEEELEKHNTLMPHSHGRKHGIDVVAQRQPDIHTKPTNKASSMMQQGDHSHHGHPDAHPIKMRHRKVSADPLHKEEDGLMDEWYDLYDKAQKGECTAGELKRIEEIRGRVDEINSSRSSDAERILGIAYKALRKAEGTVQGFQVEESDLEDNSASWRNRKAEYGDPDDLKIIPENDGAKDQVDRSESVWGTPPKDERVHVAFPDEVKNETVKKAAQVTESVISYLENTWGNTQFSKDDGRFSDPLYYSRYAESIAKAILNKHDTPGSPHEDHMTNGGGWGVKLNPKTGNFVAYQTEDGAMRKREAQGEAIRRNQKNKGEGKSNDKLQNGVDLNAINEQIMQAIKPLDVNPLYKEPRMQVGRGG